MIIFLFSVSGAKWTKQEIKMVGDLEEFVLSPSSLVQVTGEGKELATAGNETSIELFHSSQSASSFPFLFKHLSCQLTDPHHQRTHCNITSTQPWVSIVKYSPTLRGPHQMKIKINDTDIPGSPLTVQVLPSREMMVAVQDITIIGLNRPWGVAVSKSGEVVVSEHHSHCISVYSREGKKIRLFGSKGSSAGQFQYPRGVAITSDNHILIADTTNNRIQMFTMDGWFLTSVGQEGQEPLQFRHPSGIAVHPSGRVFVADSLNNRIQVLNQDLSFSHMFGNLSSVLKQFEHPEDVAINSKGVVYVTDNHWVHIFSADEQHIALFRTITGYDPTSICIDSTNTVYVTDGNNSVTVYTSDGLFIKRFGGQGSGKGKLDGPKGVVVDNTTGALYVCDYYNDRVVVY